MASHRATPAQPAAPYRRMADLWVGVWRLVGSRRLTIALLGVAMVAAILGIVTAADPPAEAREPAYRGFVSLLLALARPRSDLESRLVAVGLGALAALCLVRLLQAWIPGWDVAAPRDGHARLYEVPWSPQEAWQELGVALSVAGLALEGVVDRPGTRLGMARPEGLTGRLRGAFYLGVLLLLAANPVARWWGWSGEPIELALGQTRAMHPSDERTIRLEQLEVRPGAEGAAPRVTSVLSVAGEGGGERVRIDTGRRARVGNLALYQLGHGPAARVVANDGQGRELRLQSMVRDPEPRAVARVSFSARQQEHLLAAPQANMVVRLVHYPSLIARGFAGPVVHVRVERGVDGLSLVEEFLTEGRRLALDGVTLDVGLEYYVVVRAAREPHLPLAALGAALIVLGTIGLVAWPRRRAWVAVQARDGAATRCQVVVEPRDASAGWLAGVEAVLVERARGERDSLGT